MSADFSMPNFLLVSLIPGNFDGDGHEQGFAKSDLLKPRRKYIFLNINRWGTDEDASPAMMAIDNIL